MIHSRFFVIPLASALIAWAGMADDVFYYPAKGQDAAQVDKDKSECHVWASGQTGFDPATAPPTPDTSGVETAQQAKEGSAVRGAARGAAVGAVGGAIAGDAGKGAGAGAGAGAVAGRMRANRQVRGATANAKAQYEAALAAYNAEREKWQGAVNACMKGRGYTVN